MAKMFSNIDSLVSLSSDFTRFSLIVPQSRSSTRSRPALSGVCLTVDDVLVPIVLDAE